jgi:alpha-1,3-rhamnosyl/mannosyltransferase
VIAIDCSPLLVRSAGVKTWLYHWTRGLLELAPDRIMPVLGAPGESLVHGGGPLRHAGRLALLAALNATGGALSDILLPRCEVFHASNLLRYPPRRAKVSATLHDLTSWILPELHRSATLKADLRFAKEVLARADGIIAVSESSRRDAVRILGLVPEKIRVIYPGVPAAYFAARKPEAPAKPWFLSVGTIEPRKNLETLLDAWVSLPGDWRAGFELRVAGMEGWNADGTVRRLRRLAAEDPSVRYLGYVKEEELVELTAGAVALVYPSLYEGFGIPVAQAMAAGCPVITSNLSSLPEVTGGAALLVDPRSAAEISGAMRRMAESPALREELVRIGRERASVFTWPRACAESLDYFGGL